MNAQQPDPIHFRDDSQKAVVRGPQAQCAHTAPPASIPGPWLLSMLDQIDVPMMLVLPDATLVHANRGGRRALITHASVSLHQGRVQASQAALRSPLQVAIRHAAARGTFMLLPLHQEKERAEVAIAPIAAHRSTSPDSSAVMLALCKDSIGAPLTLHWFARRHQLTVAETRVLELLCGGSSANEVAACQNVALSTVRSHIASIRGKTCAQSIASLVHRVALLPPLMPLS